MADDIRAMSAALARNSDSLVFLELGEALRTRGQLEPAEKVTLAGLERHPHLAEAHDLYARVLVDMSQYNRAFQQWEKTVELEPRHHGAHKGLGFLCYRWNDFENALDHLELAVSADPTDQSVIQALQMVRDQAAAEEEQIEAPRPPSVFDDDTGGEQGLLLVDVRGRVLGGGMLDGGGANIADSVAAHLAGVSQEAERASRMLDIGKWQWIVVESEGGHLHVSEPESGTLLLVARDRSVPSGRLSRIAERAGQSARQWIAAQQL